MDQIYSLAVSATAWLPAMAEATLRTSGILLVSAAIAFALRGGPATLRHLVWALALVGVLLAPVGGTYLPAIDLPVPSLSPALTAAADSGLWSPGVSMPDRSQGPGSTRLFTDVPVFDAATAPTPTMKTAATATVTDVDAAGPASPVGVTSVPRRLTSVQSWSFAALGLWFAGATALLSRIGLGLLATRRLGRAAQPPSDSEWRRLATELTAQLGLTRPVQVLSSPRAAMPMTWGCRRPVVLVPATGTWPTARKRVVLLHELSHVKRYDCAWQFVANLALSLHWFNPLVWLAVRAQRVERERACDDAVVHAGTSASSYADHLLEIARSHREPRWSAVAAVAMARRSQLEGRLLSILAPGRRLRTNRRAALAVTVTMTALIGALAALTPSVDAATGPASPLAAGPVVPTVQPPAEPQTPPGSQVPPPPQVEAVLEQATTELEELQRALDERSRALSSAPDPDSDALEASRDDLARELEALSARTSALASQSAFPGLRDDLEERLREIREGAAQFMNRQREFGNERGRLGLPEMELVEQALEQARDLQEMNLDRIVDGAAIAEDVRARVRDELARVHARFSADQPEVDPRVVELLVESLSDDDAGVRERAARGLGRNRVMDASGPLSEAVRDSDAGVRGAAAWALGRLRVDTAVGPLTGALDDADPDVVEQAAEALGRIRAEGAVPALSGALTAEAPAVRARAAWALGRIRSVEAVPALSAALDDDESTVRIAAVEALGRIRDTAAVRPLLGALDDREPRIRREAAEALGRLRDAGAVDGLVGALADTAPGVVRHAVEALGRIRDPAAIEGLVGALAHADLAVVGEAAQALGRIRGDAAVDGLATGLRTAGPEAAQEIVHALGRIGGERAVEALIAAADDASPVVRKAVIEALSGPRWGNRVAAPVARPRPDANPAVAPEPN
jgi:HEAT repeat protein/beta-lactamase regulating signal transducer with metallopeptidase domain